MVCLALWIFLFHFVLAVVPGGSLETIAYFVPMSQHLPLLTLALHKNYNNTTSIVFNVDVLEFYTILQVMLVAFREESASM